MRKMVFKHDGNLFTEKEWYSYIEKECNALPRGDVEFDYDKSQKYITTSTSLKETLTKYGVAIIPNILNDEECSEMEAGMWDYIEHITKEWSGDDKPVSRNDKSTWREFYKLLPLHSFLMQHFGVGHAQVSWNLRENPKIVNVFAELWNVKPEELLVSFDGMSFGMPPEDTNRGYFRPKKSNELIGTTLEKTGKSWLHTDQSYTNNEYTCVQSWVTCFDVNEGDSTLFALESSHKYHKECGKHFDITDKSDWYPLNDVETKFYLDKGCEPIRITCKKGDMVFWDSRTIHCGCESIKGRNNPNFRGVVYLCYMPRKGATDGRLKAKCKAFEELRTTKHNPQKSLLFNKNPYDHGTPPPETIPIDKPVIGKLGKKLAGY
jgi:hypothetical protein